jgi:hypothetical protein
VHAVSESIKPFDYSRNGGPVAGRPKVMFFDTKLSYRKADDLSTVNMSQFTGNKKDLTFKMRYLVDDQYYNS